MNPKRKTWRGAIASLLIFFLFLPGGLLTASGQIETGQMTMKATNSQGAVPATVSVKSNPTGVGHTETKTLPAVLVELFTSEGCHSCPPADKVLAYLIENQPIQGVQVIALSEHVDYWNRLGWKDPFSAAEFSLRQLEYSRALGAKDVFTPQMIVDGRTGLIGSHHEKAFEAIAKAALLPKANVSVSIKTSAQKAITLLVQVENIPTVADKDSVDVMMAISENGLLSQVSKGENKGRDLTHAAVTRKLMKIGTIKDKTFSAEPKISLDTSWKRQNLNAVVFVQARSSRQVLGVAAIKLEGEM